MKKLLLITTFLSLIFITPLLSQPVSKWDVKSTPLSTSNARRFEDIFFLTPTQGWGVTLAGTLFKTSDGTNWTSTPVQNKLFGTRSLAFIDSLHGWLGVLDANIPLLETTDGGTTWTEVANFKGLKPRGICGLWIVDDSVIYGTGRFDDTARIIKTTDGGKSWEGIDMFNYALSLVDCYFTTPDSGIVVGRSKDITKGAVVLLTSDGGKTWENVHITPRIGEMGWKIYFRTNLEGYVAVQSVDSVKYYLKTVDGGKTWSEKHFTTNAKLFQKGAYPQAMAFTTEKHGWIGGYGNVTYITNDGGDTWQETSLGNNINRFRKINDTLTYVGGKELYQISTQIVNSISEERTEIKNTNISPNPVSGLSTLRFEVHQGAWSIRISNVLGQEIFKRNGESSFDTNLELLLNFSEITGGIYYCEIINGSRQIVLPIIISN